MSKVEEFVRYLERFNAKERHFFARHVFCEENAPIISERLKKSLVGSLKGIKELECKLGDSMDVLFAGFDYHLSWLDAALRLTNGHINLCNNNESSLPYDLPGTKGNITIIDSDLLVILADKKKEECFLVLIEAKGVKSFDSKQLQNKIDKIKSLQLDEEWIHAAMLLVSPTGPKKLPSDLEGLGNIPFAYMKLEGFPSEPLLTVKAVYADGSSANNKKEKKSKGVYTHRKIVPR